MNAIKILEAWNSSIRNKSEYPLGLLLHKDCKIEYFGRLQIQSKEEHLIQCRNNTNAKYIVDLQTVHDENGVCCGSHTVNYNSGRRGLVMFFGKYSGKGVNSWTSLVQRDWELSKFLSEYLFCICLNKCWIFFSSILVETFVNNGARYLTLDSQMTSVGLPVVWIIEGSKKTFNYRK